MIQLYLVFLCLTLANALSDTSCNSAYCSACDATDASICTSCIDGYILYNDDCIWGENTDLHCTSASDSVCFSCEDGYSVTTEGECIQCPDLNNCRTLKGTTCDSGCDECRNQNTYLDTTTNTCKNNDNFCADYSNDVEGECSECVLFYYLDENKQCQKGSIDQCLYYDSQTDCYMCENNLIGDTGECLSYSIDNCYQVNPDDHTECDKCNDGYQRSEDYTTCYQCDVDNCDSCVDKNSNECSYCSNNYYLVGTECTPVTNVDYCASYSRTDGSCESCTTGYYLNGDICSEITVVDFCSAYDSNECISCESGYTLNAGSCSSCSVSNCKTCDEVGVETCDICKPGYTLYNNGCVQCLDSNCDTCDESGVCKKCQTDYFIEKDFTCGKCANWCYDNSYGDDICVHYSNNCYNYDYDSDGCNRYDSDGTTCLGCDENEFTLENGKCYPYSSVTAYDGTVINCYKFEVDLKTEDWVNFEVYAPTNGVCENPFTNSEATSSETTSSETTSSETTNSESNQESSTSSGTNEESNNNNEDKGTALMIVGAVLVALLLL